MDDFAVTGGLRARVLTCFNGGELLGLYAVVKAYRFTGLAAVLGHIGLGILCYSSYHTFALAGHLCRDGNADGCHRSLDDALPSG